MVKVIKQSIGQGNDIVFTGKTIDGAKGPKVSSVVTSALLLTLASTVGSKNVPPSV
jgi:hypothetical protein